MIFSKKQKTAFEEANDLFIKTKIVNRGNLGYVNSEVREIAPQISKLLLEIEPTFKYHPATDNPRVGASVTTSRPDLLLFGVNMKAYEDNDFLRQSAFSLMQSPWEMFIPHQYFIEGQEIHQSMNSENDIVACIASYFLDSNIKSALKEIPIIKRHLIYGGSFTVPLVNPDATSQFESAVTEFRKRRNDYNSFATNDYFFSGLHDLISNDEVAEEIFGDDRHKLHDLAEAKYVSNLRKGMNERLERAIQPLVEFYQNGS